jgi:hypothetical protein
LIVGENGAGKSTILDAICFVLFNKPFRNINKPQLMNTINGKLLVVEVEFSIGNKDYRIVRGMKPGIFEIYCNDILLNQDAAARDYQKYLEESILKLNYKSFTQIVILGSASFTPFMQLSLGNRREIIEDILDIQIFTVMNAVLKDKTTDIKARITEIENDINLGGTIQIFSSKDDTSINVEAELLGKTTYTLANGTSLTNGMKLSFKGIVVPSAYSTGEYYVEGVGTAIKLIKSSILEIVSPFTKSIDQEFDYLPFDTDPFDTATGYAGQLDYVVINRSSKDHNPWSRYNRWFHKDVIVASANYYNNPPNLDQNTRAKRPIIEFHEDLRLYNFGTIATDNIDLVDSFTSNVFSVIEGTAGYNIDGVQLAQGMRVLFTADYDPLVNNKIFKVEYIDVKHLNTGSNQLHLVEILDPKIDQTVLVRAGIANQGSMYWFDGNKWNKGQSKTSVNQAPLFDILDSDKISFGGYLGYYTSVATWSTASYPSLNIPSYENKYSFKLIKNQISK